MVISHVQDRTIVVFGGAGAQNREAFLPISSILKQPLISPLPACVRWSGASRKRSLADLAAALGFPWKVHSSTGGERSSLCDRCNGSEAEWSIM